MKILFHRGKEVDKKTIMNKGEILFNGDTRIITENFIYYLDNINNVKIIRLNPFGTMITLKNNNDNIFIAVPRIYLEIGTGFVVINTYKTFKLKNMLENL